MVNISSRNIDSKISPYVKKISIFSSDGDLKYRQKLTPSAFTYLSYSHLSIPTSHFGESKISPKNRLQITGPKTNDNNYVEYEGCLQQILIEFSASGFYYLFHSSPSLITNKLSELNNYIHSQECETLEQKLISADDPELHIQYLENFLFDKLQNAIPFIDYIENALKVLGENNGSIQIKSLAKQVGISERQFGREFKKVVGISPKHYAKILQLHYVINLMNLKKYGSMQELAYQAEYFDLAHLTHHFKDLTGFTPSEFVNSNKHIALKYFTDLKK